ncbi:AP2/ERF and B3 domain-containing transcription factor At1g51120-like [Silene latifolia]|uniref:AP2/ERF and B3 domain-containing transcription factor At1g51120-like n=1 Tax=Silene latifolia TaxID=37657 RepID=UPI003D779980
MEDVTKLSTMLTLDDSDSVSSDSSPSQRPTSKYKGVVPQANGNWGAQIYANHRIWLGTFKTEDLAAAAYDSAAIKLRHGNSGDPDRNFPLNDFTCYEPDFQALYTTDQILNMIKDGSYQSKFCGYLSMAQVNGFSQTRPDNNNSLSPKEGYFCEELFRKELTPSDVGKLNRLVIPKRYALKYFNHVELGGQELELTFYDKSMKNWKFKYCYWQSSSSYVFTRGWNGFVKSKDLKAKDIVAFYNCELRGNNNNGNNVVTKFYMIDIIGFNEGEGSSSRREDLEEDVANDEELQANKVKVEEITTLENEDKGFKLFGVQMLPQNCNRD